MATTARTKRDLVIRPLTAARVDDLRKVMAGTWGSTCWDLYPRYTSTERRERGIDRRGDAGRRAALARLARRRRAPGLVAYSDGEPIGWVAIGPRFDFSKIDKSRATPPVDDVAVWVIPCITVREGHRGKGVAVAMIKKAVDYAKKLGAPAVEAYPRAGTKRLHDDYLFFGNVAMFRRAGFRQIRGRLDVPKTWVERVTMRRAIRAARS